jgi:hypothetical protein
VDRPAAAARRVRRGVTAEASGLHRHLPPGRHGLCLCELRLPAPLHRHGLCLCELRLPAPLHRHGLCLRDLRLPAPLHRHGLRLRELRLPAPLHRHGLRLREPRLPLRRTRRASAPRRGAAQHAAQRRNARGVGGGGREGQGKRLPMVSMDYRTSGGAPRHRRAAP